MREGFSSTYLRRTNTRIPSTSLSIITKKRSTLRNVTQSSHKRICYFFISRYNCMSYLNTPFEKKNKENNTDISKDQMDQRTAVNESSFCNCYYFLDPFSEEFRFCPAKKKVQFSSCLHIVPGIGIKTSIVTRKNKLKRFPFQEYIFCCPRKPLEKSIKDDRCSDHCIDWGWK